MSNPLVSIIINADTRHGYKNDSSIVGEFGSGSLQGVRSSDFLLDGVRNKMEFFRGYERQCVLYIDKHEDILPEFMEEIKSLVYSYGNNSQVVFKEHNRTKYRWYDYITLEALKLAEGTHIVHWDNDAAGFRRDDCDIVEAYLDLLDGSYKFICQPTDLPKEKHGMFWASTRFFICKKETLNFAEIEANLTTPVMGKHTPCLEHVISVLNDESVLYPPRQDDDYIIFSWARYFKGTMKKLNEMPYEKVKLYIFGEDCTLAGANDLLQHKRIEI
jgi:hypothetical protein